MVPTPLATLPHSVAPTPHRQWSRTPSPELWGSQTFLLRNHPGWNSSRAPPRPDATNPARCVASFWGPGKGSPELRFRCLLVFPAHFPGWNTCSRGRHHRCHKSGRNCGIGPRGSRGPSAEVPSWIGAGREKGRFGILILQLRRRRAREPLQRRYNRARRPGARRLALHQRRLRERRRCVKVCKRRRHYAPGSCLGVFGSALILVSYRVGPGPCPCPLPLSLPLSLPLPLSLSVSLSPCPCPCPWAGFVASVLGRPHPEREMVISP